MNYKIWILPIAIICGVAMAGPQGQPTMADPFAGSPLAEPSKEMALENSLGEEEPPLRKKVGPRNRPGFSQKSHKLGPEKLSSTPAEEMPPLSDDFVDDLPPLPPEPGRGDDMMLPPQGAPLKEESSFPPSKNSEDRPTQSSWSSIDLHDLATQAGRKGS